jgi:hypothetical protein
MQPPEQDSAARTELPRPVTLPEGQEVAGTPGTAGRPAPVALTWLPCLIWASVPHLAHSRVESRRRGRT